MGVAIFTIRAPAWIVAIAVSLGLWATIGYAVKRSIDAPGAASGVHRILHVGRLPWRASVPGRIMAS